MLHFNSLPDDLDSLIGKEILVKFDSGCYYVVIPEKERNEVIFTEAYGEQYTSWEKEDIKGYILLSELDKIPVIDNTKNEQINEYEMEK